MTPEGLSLALLTDPPDQWSVREPKPGCLNVGFNVQAGTRVLGALVNGQFVELNGCTTGEYFEIDGYLEINEVSVGSVRCQTPIRN